MSLSWRIGDQWVHRAHDWLERLEPELIREAPAPVRLLVLWVIASLLVGAVAVLVGAVGELAAVAAHGILRLVATNSTPRLLDHLADLTVRLERLMRRIGIDLQFGEEYIRPGGLHAVRGEMVDELSAELPRVIRPLAAAATTLLGFLLAIGAVVTVVGRDLAQLTFRVSLLNALTWTAVLWYLEWLAPIARWAERQAVPTISITQVAALLTMAVVAYAALGPDLRGRAEINKTASVEVRKALLAANQPLGVIAGALRRSRLVATTAARSFPERGWLSDVTGDPWAQWRFNTIDHPDRWFRRLPAKAPLLGAVPLRPMLHAVDGGQSPIPAADRGTTEQDLVDAVRRVDGLIETLDESGYLPKMQTVLPTPVGHVWSHLTSRQFHLGLVQKMCSPVEEDWSMRHLPHLPTVKVSWVDASTPAERDRAAAYTARAIRWANRSFQEDLWQLAITEHRVRMLVREVESMLNPRLMERLRQAVHK